MPSGHTVPREVRNQLITDYNAGMTYTALATKYGLTGGGVWGILSQEGIRPKSSPTIDPDQVALVTSLHLAGKKGSQIQRETGFDRGKIRRLLRSAGHSLHINKLAPDDESEVSKRYANGERTSVIATDYGIQQQIVVQIATRHGVPLRGIGNHKLTSVREDAFSTITPESAYWIGMIMSDGWVKPDIGAVSLQLKTSDAAHIAAFHRWLGYTGKIMVRAPRGTDTGSHLVTVYCRRLCDDLAKYGVTARKSFTAKVSDDLAFNRHFWRGMVDGDGTVAWQRSGAYWYCYVQLVGSLDSVTQFRDFTRSIAPSNYNVRPKNNIWCYRMVADPAWIVIRELYRDSPISLARKAAVASDIISHS